MTGRLLCWLGLHAMVPVPVPGREDVDHYLCRRCGRVTP